VRKESEPITPFISKIRALLQRGVSSILVMGGSGDYFGVSDTVVRMDCYKMKDVTAEAHAIDQRFRDASGPLETDAAYGSVSSRTPVTVYPGSLSGKILYSPIVFLVFLSGTAGCWRLECLCSTSHSSNFQIEWWLSQSE